MGRALHLGLLVSLQGEALSLLQPPVCSANHRRQVPVCLGMLPQLQRHPPLASLAQPQLLSQLQFLACLVAPLLAREQPHPAYLVPHLHRSQVWEGACLVPRLLQQPLSLHHSQALEEACLVLHPPVQHPSRLLCPACLEGCQHQALALAWQPRHRYLGDKAAVGQLHQHRQACLEVRHLLCALRRRCQKSWFPRLWSICSCTQLTA